jgi:outer membrane protein OmpA-like peptidoglycan-associated protein
MISHHSVSTKPFDRGGEYQMWDMKNGKYARHVRAPFYAFALLWGAGSVVAETQQLPLSADYCAILRAFTDKSDPRCLQNSDLGLTRSTGSAATNPFPKEAASLKTAGNEKGYFIRFAFNSVELNEEYRTHLDRLSAVFQSPAMEGVCIKLLGHTDVSGGPQYNIRLSLARAKMVESYLVGLATLSTDRIVSSGMGEENPLVNIPGGHPLNRRVEILAKAQTEGGCT